MRSRRRRVGAQTRTSRGRDGARRRASRPADTTGTSLRGTDAGCRIFVGQLAGTVRAASTRERRRRHARRVRREPRNRPNCLHPSRATNRREVGADPVMSGVPRGERAAVEGAGRDAHAATDSGAATRRGGTRRSTGHATRCHMTRGPRNDPTATIRRTRGRRTREAVTRPSTVSRRAEGILGAWRAPVPLSRRLR